jgi:TetR/AcrR family transcriptional regulator, upper aerobic nicotinate degradation pathway regulator
MKPSLENETLSKILKAARSVFSKEGFNGARVDEIAKQANVNKAMIYYHFKSKEELYDSVVDSIFSKDSLEVLNNSEEKDPFIKLEKLIRLFFDKMESNKVERCSIIAREMVSRSDVFVKMRDKYWIPDFHLINDLLINGKAEGFFAFESPSELITFTIQSHIIFYKINEVTYYDSDIFDLLYPENNQERMIKYILSILKQMLYKN